MEEEKTVDIVVAEYEQQISDLKAEHEKEISDLKKLHAQEVKGILSGKKISNPNSKNVGNEEEEKKSFLETEIDKTKKLLKL